jgi:hypothetical protein
MISFGPFSLVAGGNNTPNQAIPAYPTAGKLVILNESPFTLRVDPHDGNKKTIPAFTADMIEVASSFDGRLDIEANADITVIGSPPATVYYIETYGATENVPGTYPAPLARLVSIGNSVAVNMNNIINSGESTPQDVIRDTPAGYAAPSVQLENSGWLRLYNKTLIEAVKACIGTAIAGGNDIFFMAGLVNDDPTQTNYRVALYKRATDEYGGIQAGNNTSITAHLYAQAGGWKTDESLVVAGTLSADAGATTTNGTGGWLGTLFQALLNTTSGDKTAFDATDRKSGGKEWSIVMGSDGTLYIKNVTDGTIPLRLSSSGVTIANGVSLNTGPGFTTIHGNGFGAPLRKTSISASGTITHGLGYTPNMVATEMSVAGSQTTGHDTVTSTTYHVTLGAGFTSDSMAG